MSRKIQSGTRLAATLRLPNGNGLRFTGTVSHLKAPFANGRFVIEGTVAGPITSLTRRWPKGSA